ncbi:hypothetical protein BDV33DRAFT_210953 [Aspergillus novoparasiticus]|uniref:Uncharacterized protein n=1 Tax=Aspergillus novoparasiticus TaxID=986946 RepID=A0A5N6E652_9EURO|nr:hypothetical protein BDV33DRAFT_210953 [Aspergillus novoparasiticus]
MGQTSNKKRASKRQECREALANHIYQKLNVSIPPEQVRLKPSPEHRYAWSVCKSKEHLLEVSLSNGTVGRYESIMEELGRSIEAVAPESLQNRLANNPSRTEVKSSVPGGISANF